MPAGSATSPSVKIGDVLRAQGNLAGSLEAFKASLAIRDRLAKADPGNAGWHRDLALPHGRVARVLAQQGIGTQRWSDTDRHATSSLACVPSRPTTPRCPKILRSMRPASPNWRSGRSRPPFGRYLCIAREEELAVSIRLVYIDPFCSSVGRTKQLGIVMRQGFLRLILRAAVGAFVLLVIVSGAFFTQLTFAQTAGQKKLAVIPPNKDSDLKLYRPDGTIVNGADALDRMQAEADLILWLAGNQFFAMDDVIGTFQKAQPGVAVGLITLPPGLILSAIQGGGWVYGGKEYPGGPDIYASVNLGHLKQLKAADLMNTYATYMHNEMQIMVAKGNPKKILSIADLARSDVRTSMPNPVNEGIMQFYARKVLERHGIWSTISDGKECFSCQTTERNWFTAVHHRETPERIRDNKSDAGIVWKTEVLEALRDGAPVDAVELPPADSLRDEVSYAIGALSNGRHKANAEKYLAFLATPTAQDAYAKFGFVKARPDELILKPIQ